MIQRIQTLFLLLAVLITSSIVLMPVIHLISFDYKDVFVYITHIPLVPKATLIISILLFCVAVLLSLVAVFMFKKRRLQIKISYFSIVFQLAWVILNFIIGQNIGKLIKAEMITYKIGMFLPIASIILIYLAIRNIKKDDDLVKSVDRIR